MHETQLRGLLVDWGGVMTSDLADCLQTFCAAEGLDPQALTSAFRHDAQARQLLFAFEEGRIDERAFEAGAAELIGLPSNTGMLDRLIASVQIDQAMVAAVRAARGAGISTGLVSNSWGLRHYPRELLAELFQGTVISGEVGIRKPASRIYELGALSIGCEPAECVFVDDQGVNLAAAHKLGMATIHHNDAQQTIHELQELLGVALPAPA